MSLSHSDLYPMLNAIAIVYFHTDMLLNQTYSHILVSDFILKFHFYVRILHINVHAMF